METKKRKRSGTDTSTNRPVTKQGKHDQLFSNQASRLDQEARSSYLASEAAQHVLKAISSGKPDDINAGHAPPGLSSKQRKHWRDTQRKLALQSLKPNQQVDHQSPPVQDKIAASNISVSEDESKKRKRAGSTASIKRDDIISHLFAGVASHLDPSTQAAYIASPAAGQVIEAITHGNPEAITIVHSPDALNQKQRRKWRNEQKRLAECIAMSNSGTSASEGSQQTSLERSTKEASEIKRQDFDQKKTAGIQAATSDGSSICAITSAKAFVATNTAKRRLDSRSVGFTRLVRPPEKVWYGMAKSATTSQASAPQQKSKVADSREQTLKHGKEPFAEVTNKHGGLGMPNAARRSSSISWKPVPQGESTGQAKGRNVASIDISPAVRRSSNSSSGMLGRQRSREPVSQVAPRRTPGNRNFDIPDHFSGGTLEDTQRRFEAWARAQCGGKSDSSDSESSESDSDEDAPLLTAPAVRGSFHESWADEINAAAAKKTPKPAISDVRENAFESSESESESEDSDDVDENAEVQTQVSREMEEAAVALDEAAADVNRLSPSNGAEARDRTEISAETQQDAIPTSDDAKNLAAGQTTDQSSFDDPKIRSSSPQSRPSGTSYGLSYTTRQANVRVKRILSPTDPGGDHSGHGPAEAAKPKSKENVAPAEHQKLSVNTYQDRIDNGELSDDLYAAIDDVTQDVLGTVTSAPVQEGIPSMNECKPENPGQNRNPLITIDASAVETTNLGERADLTEGVEKDVDMDRKEAIDEDEENSVKPVHTGSEAENSKPIDAMQNEKPAAPSSPPSSLTELSHTPSPPDANTKTPSGHRFQDEPQVVVSPYVPGTPDVNGQEIAKKTRKMTGRSSKHFGVSKPVKKTRKATEPEESITVATPELPGSAAAEQASSVYETAVSRRTRSALRESSITLNDEAATPKQQHLLPPTVDAVEASPLSALEEALNAKVPATPSKKKTRSRAAPPEEHEAKSDPETKPQDTDTSSPQTFVTSNTSPPQKDSFQTPQIPKIQTPKTKTPKSKPRSTGRISTHFITDRVDLYNTTAASKRVPAGTSVAPVPSIHEPRFGIIQEKLWQQPFWLLIAVTFLNKTAGRSAVPIFWKLKEKYPTPEDLAKADLDELLEMVHSLGLQNQRSKRLVKIAEAWIAGEPRKGMRYRTLNYPSKGDGRAREVPDVVEEDANDCSGALEIGHIPGCGDYAWDSWRIFCRDVLRGVADDYNGLNAKSKDFEPEWKRVLPMDKELRACLRWMWLRDGWIWDPLTGEKREATEEEMEKAVQGEMEIEDPLERKFAVLAAGAEISPKKVGKETPSKNAVPIEEEDDFKPDDEVDEGDESDTIHLTHRPRPRGRRNSNRAVRIEPSIEEPPPSTKKNTKKKQKPEGKRQSEPEVAKSGSKRKPRTSSFRDDDEDFGVVTRNSKRRNARLTMG